MKQKLLTQLYMKRKLWGFYVDPNESLVNNINEYNNVLTDLKNIDFKLVDTDKSMILLRSLSPSYDAFIDNLCGTRGKEENLFMKLWLPYKVRP